MKGFTLNYETGMKINGDIMDMLIQDPTETVQIEKKGAITRDAKTKTLVNKDQIKTFSLGYDKRVINNFNTLPYGYRV